MNDEEYKEARDEAAKESTFEAHVKYNLPWAGLDLGFLRGADWGREYGRAEARELIGKLKDALYCAPFGDWGSCKKCDACLAEAAAEEWERKT